MEAVHPDLGFILVWHINIRVAVYMSLFLWSITVYGVNTSTAGAGIFEMVVICFSYWARPPVRWHGRLTQITGSDISKVVHE